MIGNKNDKYDEAFNALDWVIKNKIDYLNEKDLYSFIFKFKDFIYNNIHKILANKNTKESEDKIRSYCQYVIDILLPISQERNIKFNNKLINNKITEDELFLYKNWLELQDDLMAIASYRSLSHFACYLETQDPDINKVWKYTMETTMGSVFYYAQEMILNHKYTNLIKQCPTGFGKSKSDCVIICFIFGYDPNATIMKIVGNPSVVKPIFNGLVNMIKSPKFGKVFPMYGQYNGEDSMFKECKCTTSGAITFNGSKAGRNFFIVSKDTALDGTRYNYQFYDDVTRSKEKHNVSQHKKDIEDYLMQWSQRRYDEHTVLRFLTGTSYHIEDFLSWAKKYYGDKQEYEVDIEAYKKYKWARWAKLSNDKRTVYIGVPGLIDLELGEEVSYSSFPERFPKKDYIKSLHENRENFMAITQQTPVPSVAFAFDWSRINTYSILPKEIENNDCSCYAIIDPTRKSKDYYCCLIFKESKDKKYYLVDCYYKKVSSKIAIPELCSRLAHHKVEKIYYEMNATDADLIEEKIKESMKNEKWLGFSIESIYSYKNKEEKIVDAQDEIKEKIVFPMRGLYHKDSMMGIAMEDIVNYSFEGKNDHDDSIDCCAMFVNAIEVFVGAEMEFYSFGF